MVHSIAKLLGSYFAWKTRPHKLRRDIARLRIERSDPSNPIDPTHIRVAVVQEKIMLLKSTNEYIERMHRFVKKAAQQRSQLVVFPELNGLLTLGMLPFIEPILQKNEKKLGFHSQKVESQPQQIELIPLLSALTPFILNVFTTTFSELAKAYGIYIMAGSTLLVENDRLYNRAFLFGPEGELVGTQDKAHPVTLEKELGLTQADKLHVFETKIGRLAFPVCMDATYYEAFKIVKSLGAKIVMIPIANMEDYDKSLAFRGIWPRVQESGVFGLKSALVGDLYGIRFTGKAGIYAPLMLTPAQNGILAEASSYDEDDLICGTLDLTSLESYHDPYFSDRNPLLYEKYLPQVYGTITTT